LVSAKNQKFVVDKSSSFSPGFGKGETFVCVPKVQYNRQGIPVVRAKLGLRQLLLSMGSQVVKCKEFIMSKRELLYPIRQAGECF